MLRLKNRYYKAIDLAKQQATEIRILKIELEDYKLDKKPKKAIEPEQVIVNQPEIVQKTKIIPKPKIIIARQNKEIKILKATLELQKETIRKFALKAIKQPKVVEKRKKKSSPNEKHLKRHYDLTPLQYAEMLASQKGVCYLCNKTNKSNRNLHVDHDHDTGKVRALLCSLCNTMLGMAKDNPETLEKGAEYIRIHQKRAKIKLTG